MTELLEKYDQSKPRGEPDTRPQPWSVFRGRIRHRWAMPFLFIDWILAWAAFRLKQFSLLRLLEACSSLTLLIGVIIYFYEAPERAKSKHYQAWQVINTAQGRGGNGGRIDALHELNEDGVPLVGVDVSESFLERMELKHADLRRANFRAADLKDADLRGSHLEQCYFVSANCRGADLADAEMIDADFTDADLNGAKLQRANLQGVTLDKADLRDTDLSSARNWQAASVALANIHGAHAPKGFSEWALAHGAVDLADNRAWDEALKTKPTAPTTNPARSTTMRAG